MKLLRSLLDAISLPSLFLLHALVTVIHDLEEDRQGIARSEFILAGVVSMSFLSVYQYAFQDYVFQYTGGSGIGQLFLGNFSVWVFSIFFTFMLLRQIKQRRQVEQQ